MRVLVATLPLWGHIQPLLPLATALQRRGHELVWASGPDACPRIERLGIKTAPAGLTEADFSPRAQRVNDAPLISRRTNGRTGWAPGCSAPRGPGRCGVT